MANEFNRYFTNVGPLLAQNISKAKTPFENYLNYSNAYSAAIFPTDSLEVKKIIKKLKNDASPGPDEIPPSVIKIASNLIADKVAKLVNYTLESGVFPSRLKLAKVIPIHKDGDSSLCTNYRPISILNIFSKIYEAVIKDRMDGFIKANDLIYKFQFGFRCGHSTDLALISLVDNITHAIDQSHSSLSIFA